MATLAIFLRGSGLFVALGVIAALVFDGATCGAGSVCRADVTSVRLEIESAADAGRGVLQLPAGAVRLPRAERDLTARFEPGSCVLARFAELRPAWRARSAPPMRLRLIDVVACEEIET
jgi:hypothetical protein